MIDRWAFNVNLSLEFFYKLSTLYFSAVGQHYLETHNMLYLAIDYYSSYIQWVLFGSSMEQAHSTFHLGIYESVQSTKSKILFVPTESCFRTGTIWLIQFVDPLYLEWWLLFQHTNCSTSSDWLVQSQICIYRIRIIICFQPFNLIV